MKQLVKGKSVINSLGPTSCNQRHNLNGGKPTGPKLRGEGRSKKDQSIHIHQLGDLESDLLSFSQEKDETDALMQEFDVDELNEKSKLLESQVDSYLDAKIKRDKTRAGVKESSSASRYLCKPLESPASTVLDSPALKDSVDAIGLLGRDGGELDRLETGRGSHMLEDLIGNEERVKATREKYRVSKPHVRASVIQSTSDVRKVVDQYRHVINDILEGQIGSYFYNEAKKLQQRSQLRSIRDDEIRNLPKHTYYGYIGAVRGFHLGKGLENDDAIFSLLKSKARYSTVIQFYGVANFIQYVLVPEIIAHITLDCGRLQDMDAAYDEMEDCNDYGMYVTNSIPLEQEDAEEGEPGTEMQGAAQLAHGSQDTPADEVGSDASDATDLSIPRPDPANAADDIDLIFGIES